MYLNKVYWILLFYCSCNPATHAGFTRLQWTHKNELWITSNFFCIHLCNIKWALNTQLCIKFRNFLQYPPRTNSTTLFTVGAQAQANANGGVRTHLRDTVNLDWPQRRRPQEEPVRRMVPLTEADGRCSATCIVTALFSVFLQVSVNNDNDHSFTWPKNRSNSKSSLSKQFFLLYYILYNSQVLFVRLLYITNTKCHRGH